MKVVAPTAYGRIWKWPIAVAGASALGLVSALIGDGVWDALSWVALSAPVVISVVALRRKDGRRAKRTRAATSSPAASAFAAGAIRPDADTPSKGASPKPTRS